MVGRIDPVVLFAILVASALATAQGVPLVREDAANVSFSYPDGSSLLVRLAGAGGDMARVTFVPSGANTSFLRYQGFIRTESLATDLAFHVEKLPGHAILSRPGWALNVSLAAATVALIINGSVVSRELAPPSVAYDSECDPKGWQGLAPGVGTTVAVDGRCLRSTRTLSGYRTPPNVVCCTSYQDPVSGMPTGPCALSCPGEEEVVSQIGFVDYGTALGTCGRFTPDPACTAANYTDSIRALVTAACLGRSGCNVTRKSEWGDPCRGVNTKRLTISATCGNTTASKITTASGSKQRAAPSTDVEDEQVFGFGQSVTPGLNAAGSSKFIATFSRTTNTGPSHAPAPFYVSLSKVAATGAPVAHGYFLNTHGYSAFDVGANSTDKLAITTPDPVLDYFLFAGPTPSDVVGQFTNVTGRMTLPPKWAMGLKYDPWNTAQDQAYVESVVHNFSAYNVALDRVILEPAWQSPQYSWDTHRYPNVTALVESIAPTKLILWEHPILDNGTTLYGNLSSNGCIAAPEQGDAAPVLGMPPATAFSDLTVAQCRKIWSDFQLSGPVKSGAVGFKLDEDDVDASVGFLDSTRFPSGFRGYQFHNIQGYIWQRMYHEMFESLGQRTWLQSRGNYAGGQAYPTNSYSDGYTYETYVRGVVNSGFSGLMWAPEMRRATCDNSFVRRTQLMFLSPQAQYNAWNTPTPGAGDPWSCGDAYMAMFKANYDLRAGLATYLYSAFRRQSVTGVPAFRPLVLDSPGDNRTYSVDDQYLIGDSLMFAPAGMGDINASSRKVYFPSTAPSWHLFSAGDNGSAWQPGQATEVPAPLSGPPLLFVKAGAAVPFQSPSGAGRELLRLYVWPAMGGSSEMTWTRLYDDDGTTTRYKTARETWDAHAGVELDTKGLGEGLGGSATLRFRAEHQQRYQPSWKVVVWVVRHAVRAPSAVMCDGDLLHLPSNRARTAPLQPGEWRHSAAAQTLSVAVSLEAADRCTVHWEPSL